MGDHMTKYLLSIVFVAAAVSIPEKAQAIIYIEPYAGWEQGTGKISVAGNAPAPINAFTVEDQISLHGGAFGGRVGFSVPFVAFGADVYTGKISDDRVTDIGGFVRVSVFGFFNVHGTYIASATDKQKEDPDLGVVTSKGNGFKAGIGFNIFPFVDLNFDYISVKYDEAESSLSGVSFSSVDVKRNSAFISLSVPINL